MNGLGSPVFEELRSEPWKGSTWSLLQPSKGVLSPPLYMLRTFSREGGTVCHPLEACRLR